MGVNLAVFEPWGKELPFVDLFRQGSGWLPQEVPHNRWNTGQPLDLDADGWVRSLRPGQAAGVVMGRDLGTHYPAGDYVCLYDGDGDLEFGFDGTVVNRTPGRIVVRVTPNSGDGVWMRIVRTAAANPVRNIRFIMPGFESTYQDEPFHPDFLARWSKFKVLRFMDWQRTNAQTVERWADRSTPMQPFQTGPRGVCLEHILALCNRLDADPWLCVPLRADDDYVRNMAQLVKDRLETGRTVYIEHSNEVWNTAFPQHNDASARGRAQNLHSSPYDAALYYHGRRTVSIGAAFESTLGAERVVRVLGMQAAVPWWVGHVLDYDDVGRNIDAVAIAPYFGNELGNPATQTTVARMSVNDVMDYMRRDIDTVMTKVAESAGHCARYTLDLIAYEGGQHLAGYGGAQDNDTLTQLFIRVNGDPAIEQIYADYYRRWRTAGGKLFVPFNSLEGWSKWGCWGLVRWHDSDLTREWKYKATVDFLDANPRWW